MSETASQGRGTVTTDEKRNRAGKGSCLQVQKQETGRSVASVSCPIVELFGNQGHVASN